MERLSREHNVLRTRDYVQRVILEIEPKYVNHVVILLHGIRTAAEWQDDIRDSIEGIDIIVRSISYDFFDIGQFVVPTYFFRLRKIDYVLKQIIYIRNKYPNAELSFIAHSFGSYIVSEIIKRQIFGRFNRIILCGSIVKIEFPWNEYAKLFRSVLNDCGTHDYWPVVAEIITFGYGASGFLGFTDVEVENRFHRGFRHSDFLNGYFAKQYWRLYLREGTVIKPMNKRDKVPYKIQLIRIFPIKYILWPAATLAAIFGVAAFL